MPHARTPYNFVPVGDRIVPAEKIDGKYPFEEQDFLHPDRNTGWLDIQITTLTPLYTRGAKKPNDISEDAAEDYFHYGDRRPILPGSSLRGMVRSVFEAMTMSRMEFLSDRRLFYRSFAEAAGNIRALYQSRFTKDRLCAGQLIERDGRLYLLVSEAAPKGFVLVSASEVRADWQRRGMHEYPAPRDVQVTTTSQQHGMLGVAVARLQGSIPGWLIVPGRDVPKKGGAQRKWFQVILKPEGQRCREYAVPKDVYEDYLNWGAMAHGNRFKTPKAPRFLGHRAPAFALLSSDGKQVEAIGANMMMHLRYETSIGKAYERSLTPESANVDVDMAQSVFGRVREGNDAKRTDQIRSRVFFQDAICNQVAPAVLLDPGNPVKVPDVLSGPKPTAFQVYLRQDARDLAHWDSKSATIAGRKMYWHRSPSAAAGALKPDVPEGVSDTQITRITPLKAGLTFKARIRFENLTDAELGALYASVHLPSGMAHKFGMGKNMGLGSVRVDVTDAVLVDVRARYLAAGSDVGLVAGDAVRERLIQAYGAFVRLLFRNSTTLWANRRMIALAAMLSWDGRPSDEETQQVGFSDQWKYRWTLQSPTVLGRSHGIMDVLPVSPSSDVEGGEPDDGRPLARANDDPPSRPRPAGAHVGDRVPGQLVAKSPAGTGTVLLDDGTEVKGVPGLYGCRVGETYRFKVIDVGGDGKVRKLVRA